MRQKMHAAAANCCSATKNRKSSMFWHHTSCLPQPHADLQQILRLSECAFNEVISWMSLNWELKGAQTKNTNLHQNEVRCGKNDGQGLAWLQDLELLMTQTRSDFQVGQLQTLNNFFRFRQRGLTEVVPLAAHVPLRKGSDGIRLIVRVDPRSPDSNGLEPRRSRLPEKLSSRARQVRSVRLQDDDVLLWGCCWGWTSRQTEDGDGTGWRRPWWGHNAEVTEVRVLPEAGVLKPFANSNWKYFNKT